VPCYILIGEGKKMPEFIQSKEELISYLTTKRLCRKTPPDSVNVTAKIRREVMTDEKQGRFVVDGSHKLLKFENAGGGVYIASIQE